MFWALIIYISYSIQGKEKTSSYNTVNSEMPRKKNWKLQPTENRIQTAQAKEDGALFPKKCAMAESVLIFTALQTSNLVILL
jgi:hypothetical protein